MRAGKGYIAWIAALLLTASCRGGKTFPHAPVILISIDTLRSDHLPDYGYKGVETPSLQAFRKDSILYERAYSQVPLTLPSHAALFTGLPPYENGVRDNIGFRLSPSHQTLAALLKASGYATGAAVSSYLLRGERGIGAGFDSYDDRIEKVDQGVTERAGMQTEAALEQWIDSETGSGSLLFAFLHLYEPHTPYDPPEPYKTRYAGRLYDGEIAAADAIVGRLLAYLKKKNLYDPAIVIVLSDHGEGLNDHGEEEHSVLLYREDIQVPLYLKLPGSRSAGKTITAPVALTDVFPTVAALVGIPVPASVHGVNLVTAGEEPRALERRVYSETLYPRLHLGWSDLASLTDGGYQYIEAPRPEIYDLRSDPAEKHDLSASLPPAFRSMRLDLSSLNRPFVAPEASSSEELKKLAALGYITVQPPAAPEKNLPDPKDRMDSLALYHRLYALFFAKDYAQTIVVARELLAKEPKVIAAWRMLGLSLARTGKPDEGIKVLSEGLAQLGPGGVGQELSEAYQELADLLARRGDQAGAEKVLREALQRNLATDAIRRDLVKILILTGRTQEALVLLGPLEGKEDPETLDSLGVSLAEAGQLAQAREAFQKALAINPGNPDVLSHMGTLSLRERNAAAARQWFEKALQKNPNLPGTLTSLGTALVQLGEDQQALVAWKKAMELDPKQYDALFNLAILTGRHRQFDEARQYLEQFVAVAPRDRYGEELAEANRILRNMKAKSLGQGSTSEKGQNPESARRPS